MISSKPKTTTIPKTDGHQETATLQPSTTLEISSSPTRQDVALQVRIMSRHGKLIERGFFNKSSLDKVTQSSYYLRICDYWTYYVVYRLHRKDFTSLSNLRSLSLYCLATSDDKSLKKVNILVSFSEYYFALPSRWHWTKHRSQQSAKRCLDHHKCLSIFYGPCHHYGFRRMSTQSKFQVSTQLLKCVR